MMLRKHFVTFSALAILSSTLAMPGTAVAQASPNLSGSWQLSCPQRKATLQIAQNGSKLSGTFSGGRSGKLSGSVQGDQITLKMGGYFRSISLTGTTDGKSMTVHTPKGVSCTALRQ
jgi:invasion protein IalB